LINTRNYSIVFWRKSVLLLPPRALCKGFFKKLFTSKKEAQPQKFQVVVQSSQGGAVVSVRDAGGAPDQTDSATGILKVLLQETR
jgi:hypothetical protein